MDPVLGLLGLARRSGNLVLGEEPVTEACAQRRARLVLVARDAGENTARRAQRLAQRGEVPLITLPYEKATLGDLMGRASCALLAPTDVGLSASLVRRLAQQEERLLPLAEELAGKAEHRQQRRAKKKKTLRANRSSAKAEP